MAERNHRATFAWKDTPPVAKRFDEALSELKKPGMFLDGWDALGVVGVWLGLALIVGGAAYLLGAIAGAW